MKTHSRKHPCELCGVNTGSKHNKACKWAYIPRDSNKARKNKVTLRDKVKNIIQILKL